MDLQLSCPICGPLCKCIANRYIFKTPLKPSIPAPLSSSSLSPIPISPSLTQESSNIPRYLYCPIPYPSYPSPTSLPSSQSTKRHSRSTGLKVHKICSQSLYSEHIRSLSLSSDNRYIFCLTNTHTIRVWSLKTQRELTSFSPNYSKTNFIVVSHDNSRILCAFNWNRLQILDLNTHRTSVYTNLNLSQIESMIFSRDDRFIISGGLYDSMKIWNSRTLRVIYELEVNVKNFCLSGNNRSLAAIQYGYGILIFDLLTQQVSKIPTKPGRMNTCIAFSPDSSKIISGSYFGIVEIWNATSLVLERSFKAQLYRINSISMSRDGKVLVCSGTKRLVKVWNMEDISLQSIIKGGLHRMYESWMSNRKFIVTAGRNKTLGVWEIK